MNTLLIPCFTCKQNVARGAKLCPHCGQQYPSIQSIVNALIPLLITAACVGGLMAYLGLP